VSIFSAAAKPAGIYLASKMKELLGKHALNTQFRAIIKELEKHPETTPEDRTNLKKLLGRSSFDQIFSASPEELTDLFVGAGISPEIAAVLVDKIRLTVLELAQNNVAFFYKFMVNAEQDRLDGIQEIKTTLGLGTDALAVAVEEESIATIRGFFATVETAIVDHLRKGQQEIKSDTEMILEAQKDVVLLLRELKERMLVLDISANLSSEGFVELVEEHEGEYTLYDGVSQLLSVIASDLEEGDLAGATHGLFKAAKVFFDLYKLYENEVHYDLGKRCYSMAKSYTEKPNTKKGGDKL